MNPIVREALDKLRKIDPKEAKRAEAFYKAGVADGIAQGGEIPEGLQAAYESERWTL